MGNPPTDALGTPPMAPPPGPPPPMAWQPAHVPAVVAPARAATERGSRAPWVVAVVAVVVALLSTGLLLVTTFGAQPVSGEVASNEGRDPVERGFATPEDAASYVMDRVIAGDLEAAGEGFATTHMVDGYSFERYVDFIGSVPPSTWLPAEDYRVLDLGTRRGEIAMYLRSYVRHLTAPTLEVTVTVELTPALTADDVAADLDLEDLGRVSVERVDRLGGDGADRRRAAQTYAAIWGAEDSAEVGMLLDTPSGAVEGGMQLLRYEGRWYVMALNSHMLGQSLAQLSPTSPAEYAATIMYLAALNSDA